MACALALGTTFSLVQPACSATVVVRQTADVRVSPDGVSRVIAKLPAQAQVEQLSGRFGPWIQVRTEQGLVGWLLSLNLVAAHATAPSLQAARPLPVPVPVPAPVRNEPVSSPTSSTVENGTVASSAWVATAPPMATSFPTNAPASAMTSTASAPVAAPVATPVAAATDAVMPLAEQRLLQMQTYRAESEAARRFAFRAGLELAKVPPGPKEGMP